MAEIWRAAAVGAAGFSRVLAVKRMLPHLAAQPSFVRMFVDEAKIAAVLNHPNILQVLDLGQHAGLTFLTMEFVAGRSLSGILTACLEKKLRLPLPFCVSVVAQALDGLHFAHEKRDSQDRPMKIIHRDISPQNIMVGFDGTVRLADFGIAKAAQRTSDTAEGCIRGKASYMAPEQVRAEAFDQRADLYAMGVVLYELLSMKCMRRGTDDLAVLMEAATGAYARFEERGVDIPQELAAVVYQALGADRDARWQTAAEFSRALRMLQERNTGGSPPLSDFMNQLFPEEVAAELAAQRRFAVAMEKFASANTMEINLILSREGAQASAQGRGPLSAPSLTLPGQSSALEEDATEWVEEAVMEPPAEPQVRRRRSPLALFLGMAAVLGAALVPLLRAPPTGTVVVTSSPPGALIHIDGEPRGPSPVTLTELPPGALVVNATAAGFEAATQQLTVTAGDVTAVSLVLQPSAVTIMLTTSPAGAVVKVDGVAAGTAPLLLRLARSTLVRLTAELTGYLPMDRALIPEQAPSSMTLELEPVPVVIRMENRAHRRRPALRTDRVTPSPQPSGTGLLALQSKPWARIFVDGADTGRFTPVTNLQVPTGQHTVRLVNEETGLSSEFSVDVATGATVKAARILN